MELPIAMPTSLVDTLSHTPTYGYPYAHYLPVVKTVEAEEKTDDEAVAVAKKTVLPYYHHPLTYSGYYPYSYGYPYPYGYGLPVVKPAVAKKEKRSAEAET